MIVTASIEKVRGYSLKARKKGKIIGFVPTMGALHRGHMSLVEKAKKECDFVIASIFINPIQFGPGEDLGRYPRNFKRDKNLLEKAEVDLVFYPKAETMYPKDSSTYVHEINLSKVLCGKLRRGHFSGVATVVAKLFNIVEPDIVYLGQKDYQQAQIVRKLIDDLKYNIKIKVLPIVREKDGLAMSSRNAYLALKERGQSRCLYQALSLAKDLIRKGEKDPKRVLVKMRSIVKSQKSTKIDYIEIIDAKGLGKISEISGNVLIAMAVYVGKTRLIDNIVLNVKK